MNRSTLAVLAVLFAPLAARAEPASADVLVTVDGRQITRKEVAERVWARHADEALNQIVDEAVLDKAVTAWRQKLTKKEQEAVSSEIQARLKSIKGRFKDEAAFAADLEKNGVKLAGLERQIRDQVERERLIVSANKLSVAPDEIKQFYDANKDKLGPPAVRLRHFVVAEERQARDHLTALRVGADFSKLAEQISLDAATKKKGGDLGFITAAMLPQEYQQQVMALKPGEVSDVLRFPDGFHVFKAEERREPKTPSFPEIEKDLAQAILARKIEAALPAYMAQLRGQSKIAAGQGVSGAGRAAAKVN